MGNKNTKQHEELFIRMLEALNRHNNFTEWNQIARQWEDDFMMEFEKQLKEQDRNSLILDSISF